MTQNERLKAKQRLIELFETSPSIVGSATWREYYEQTADHFLDNGVIVPPCEVEDTVYVIDDGIVYEEKVDFFDLIVATDCGFHSAIDVFTTREAAEQAFKERET